MNRSEQNDRRDKGKGTEAGGRDEGTRKNDKTAKKQDGKQKWKKEGQPSPRRNGRVGHGRADEN